MFEKINSLILSGAGKIREVNKERDLKRDALVVMFFIAALLFYAQMAGAAGTTAQGNSGIVTSGTNIYSAFTAFVDSGWGMLVAAGIAIYGFFEMIKSHLLIGAVTILIAILIKESPALIQSIWTAVI